MSRIMEKSKLEEYLKAHDVISFRISRLVEEFLDDWDNNPLTTDDQKSWALERGFISDKINLFGLTDENYTEFISDLDFYNIHSYKNGKHSRWFDDKLTTWYMLSPFKDLMPTHYCYLNKGAVSPLDTESGRVVGSFDDILRLLSLKGILAFKCCSGGHGVGFAKVEMDDNLVLINKAPLSIEFFIKEYLPSLDNVIVTEFVNTTGQLLKVTNGVPCVGRAVTVFADGEAHLTAANLRFASDVGESVVDYEGTVYFGVNLSDGFLFSPSIRRDYGSAMVFEPCHAHPSTGIELRGRIPQWESCVEGFLNMASWLKPAPYLVFDFVPTERGMKILEINSHGQQRIMQPFHPFFRNEWNKVLFEDAYLRTIERATRLHDTTDEYL